MMMTLKRTGYGFQNDKKKKFKLSGRKLFAQTEPRFDLQEFIQKSTVWFGLVDSNVCFVYLGLIRPGTPATNTIKI